MAGPKRAKQGYLQRNRKRDANEPEIIEALGKLPGVTTYPLDKPLDLLVGFRGITDLIEVKNPDGANRIEADQQDFFDTWKGRPAIIVRSVDDVHAWHRRVLTELGDNQCGLSGVRLARQSKQ